MLLLHRKPYIRLHLRCGFDESASTGLPYLEAGEKAVQIEISRFKVSTGLSSDKGSGGEINVLAGKRV